jgi:thiamine-phosphate diphosphorylase
VTPDWRLLAVLDPARIAGGDPVGAARAVLAGGATALQLRDKTNPPRAVLALARELAPLCREAGVAFLVNDRPDLARAAGADGAHVGPDDLPPDAARTVLGDRLLGVSARTPDRVAAAEAARADLIGAGAWRATGTKREAAVLGPDGFAALARATRIPVVAIGGVRPADVAAVRRAGGVGVAVVSGLFAAPDPAEAARAYRHALDLADA